MKNPERTREIILRAALHEVHRKGFRATSLNDILARTDLTKGELYQLFPDKCALGHAMLDALDERIVGSWLVELGRSSDPIVCLRERAREAFENMTSSEVEMGCPLNNLAQEMSGLDEAFRTKVAAIYERWCNGIAQTLIQGQQTGIISRGVNPDDAAMFYVAVLSGSRGLTKNARSSEMLNSCLQGLSYYLEALKA
jgi:TetR/AcrR family transcriptional regulator, transcriptional repressor for nem operon